MMRNAMKKVEKNYLYKLNMDAFRKAIKTAGSIKKFHQELAKISREGSSVSSIVYALKVKRISPQLAVLIEKYTKGEITRKKLLPNLF